MSSSVVLVKDAPHSRVAQGLMCLSSEGVEVTSDEWQTGVVSDPFRRVAVVAAIRGELSLPTISPEQWVEREMAIGARLVEYGLLPFDEALVKKGAGLGVTPDSRFIPAGLTRRQLLEVAGEAGIHLNGGTAKTADYSGEEIPTNAHTFQLDYQWIFRPYGGKHPESSCPPFKLDYDQQWKLACEYGGKGFATAETVIYVAILRPFVENGNEMPFMGGAIRCRNARGSDDSLRVYWSADVGLDVFYYCRSNRSWNLWALPEVLKELVP